MKTKLLKKIRIRFNILHNQVNEKNLYLPVPFAIVYDRKEGIGPEKYEYKCHYRISNEISTISSPTLTERLTLKIMNMAYIVKHRKLVNKRKNKTLNLKLIK